MNSIWQLTRHPQAGAQHPHQRSITQLDEAVTARAAHQSQPLTPDELEELRTAHARWGADAATLANIERLGAQTARVIVTGQQPAPLAGPLLVIYKTLGAIRLASELQSRHPDLHFVPVFWVASEDHDFDEIKRVIWPAFSGSLETALLPPESHLTGQMIGTISTRLFWDRLRDQIQASLNKTEFTNEVLSELDTALGHENATLEESFVRLLLRLMRGLGLVVVTPGMQWLRRRGEQVLRHDFEQAGEFSKKLNTRGAELASQFGIQQPLTRTPGALNGFWIDPAGRRHTLRRSADGTIVRALAGAAQHAGEKDPAMPAWTVSELLTELVARPGQFSCNAITRPMLQDSALPTVAQVVGPGEAAYLAQVEALYPEFGVFAPVRYPRPEVLLLEPRVARQMEKYGITLEDALGLDLPALSEATVRRSLTQTDEVLVLDELEQRQRAELQAMRTRLADGDLRAEAKPDPAIEGAFDKLDGMLQKGYATIRERVLYKRLQTEGQLQRAVGIVHHSLHPNGQHQERVLNPILPFAMNYGMDWVPRLAEKIDISPETELQVIEMQGV